MFFSMVVELHNGIDFASNLTGVPLGRTEVLVVPNAAPFRESSREHGPRGTRIDGRYESCVCHGFRKVLVVQSSG